MGVNDYGTGTNKLNAPSLASWAASVAAAFDGSDTTVSTRIAAAVDGIVSGDIEQPWVSPLAYGAVGDGTTDDTAAINAALSDGAGGVVLFPPLTFRVDGSLLPQSDTVIDGPGATIVKYGTKHQPVFDIVQKSDVTVRGLRIEATHARTYTGGGNARGDDDYALWAAIYGSGTRITVEGCTLVGFTEGVYLNQWNGSAQSGTNEGHVVKGCRFEGCDFGVLTRNAHDTTITGIRGTYARQTGSPNLPHLVYLSGATANDNVKVEDAHAWDSDDGHAFQAKYATNLTMSGLTATRCNGILSLQNVTGFTAQNLSEFESVGQTSGSLYLQAGCADGTVRDIYIDGAGYATTYRFGRITGDRITCTNLTSRANFTAQTDNAEWVVDGDDITIDGVTSLNASTYGAVVVSVYAGSDRFSLRGLRAVNCRNGLVGDATASGLVEIDTRAIVNGSAVVSPLTYTAGGLTVRTESTVGGATTLGFYGTTPGAKPTITGSRGSNAALASLLTQLASLGLITDSTSA